MTVILFLVTIPDSHAQIVESVKSDHCEELGIPLIHNYYPYDFGGKPRLAYITEDENGIIYFSNYQSGCFTFNGSNFSQFNPFPDSLIERQITLTDLAIIKDSLWITSGSPPGYFGYVTRDVQGQFLNGSINLIDMPDSLTGDGGTFAIEEFNGDIYVLKSGKALIRIRNGQLKAWAVNGYRNIFKVHQKLYIPAEDSLYVLEDDRLHTVTDWDTRAMGWVRAILPLDDGSILLASPTIIYKYDGINLQPLNDLGKLIPNSQIWRGVKLQNGHYALGSFGNGIYIIDAEGRLCLNINKQHGLGSNTISSLYYSSSGELWATTDNSLSLVDLTSAFTYFDLNHGIFNHIRGMTRVADRLYTGSRGGLSFLNTKGREPEFERIDYLQDFTVRSIVAIPPEYFATTNNGIYQLFEDTVLQVVNNDSYSGIHRLGQDSTLYLLKKNTLVQLLERDNGEWVNHGTILEHKGEGGFLEDMFGNIWIMDYPGYGISRIQFHTRESVRDQLLNRSYFIERYPDISWPSLINGQVYISSDSSLLRYDPASNSFIPDPLLSPEENKPLTDIFRIIEGNQNELWIYSRPGLINKFPGGDSASEINPAFMYWHAVATDSGRYVWDNSPFRLLQPKLEFLNLIYPDKDGITWFAGINGTLARYDPSARESGNALSMLMINEILLPEQDSILFSGNAQYFAHDFTLNPSIRDIRVRYNVVDFLSADSVFYRYRLEGFDDKWSAWSHENYKDYTGLGPGEYTFRVQATDYFGENLVEASFGLIKFPPWYARKEMIFGYVILFVGIIYLVFKWRLRALENEKQKLEQMVKKRTMQLAEHSRRLREINEAKNRFFSNISHEFRTPLTLILGYIQKLFRTDHSSERAGTYRNLDRNARQLLQLVNQLLELAKLESGRITTNPVPTSLYQLCDRLIASYMSMAESRNIFLAYDFEMDKAMYVNIDADKFRSIVHNLISNAFKFTSSGGKITLRFRLIRIVDEQVTFRCTVKDTGKGISEEHLSKIFDRFYQAEPNYSDRAYGTGIGLSIVRDYVRLMDGRIEVRSKPDKGTEFEITMTAPLAQERLDPGEYPEVMPVLMQDTENEVEPEAADDGVTILVVEDNPSMRSYIREILAGEFNVALAEDGRHGLDCAIRMLPDLIISDVMMPKLDGIQLLAELKGDIRTSHIPIIMLTALSEKEDRFRGLEHGADDYLIKPFDEEELKILIRNRLEQRKNLREKWSYSHSLLPSDVMSLDDKFLSLVQASVEENLGNSLYGVNDLATDVGMSRSQLHRKLTSLTNYSAGNFIRAMRLQRAYLLLQANSGTVSEIAYEVGFSSPQYFSECFRTQYGHSPGKLKNSSAGTAMGTSG